MTSMAANQPDGSINSTTAPGGRKQYRLDVEAFTLSDTRNPDGNANIVHFEDDPNLYMGVDRALGNDPAPPRKVLARQAGLVLIELGIDGHPTHRVRVARTGNYPGAGAEPGEYEEMFNYPREEAPSFILGDAIEALQAVLDQLLVMRTADEARAAEHNAIRVGEDYGRSQAGT